MLGTVCVYAQPLRNGMSQRHTGRVARSSSSFWKRNQWSLREMSRLVPSIRPHGQLLLLLMQKKPTSVPDREAFNPCIGDGFSGPRVEDESEASKDEQADSLSENNVGNGALIVIGCIDLAAPIFLFLRGWKWQR